MFAYGPADATASRNPTISCLFKSRQVFPFWYRLTQAVLEKRKFNSVVAVLKWQIVTDSCIGFSHDPPGFAVDIMPCEVLEDN